MSELLDFYEQQARARFSNLPWLASSQEKALADFVRMGFPVRQLEDWKYTLVDSFLQQQFLTDEPDVLSPSVTPDVNPVPVSTEIALSLINGVVVDAHASKASLPAGVVVQSMAEALVEHADKIKPYLGQILKQQHGFHALNTAMLHYGVFIYLPAGVRLTTPILLSHWQDKTNHAAHIRHLVVAEEGSSASIIEDYHGNADVSYFTNTITEVCLAANATVTHYKIQRESSLAYHIGHVAVQQAAHSQFNSHSFSIGGKLVRSDITIGLHEPGAHCLMNGIYAPSDKQHVDHHTVVTHDVPDCSSEQDYKGILSGQSRAVFNGRVIVAKDAQHTLAQQQNKNLLLSAKAEIDTKPQLEIFADDVVCTHGATVGQLDEEALFYLAARGIGRAEANRYLVQAFASENMKKIANPELADWLSTLLNQQLG